MSCLDALDVIPRGPVPNPQALANLVNRESLVIESGNAPLYGRRQWRPRNPFALRTSAGHPRLDAGADEGTFKLGEGRHHREDHFALGRRRIDVLLKVAMLN